MPPKKESSVMNGSSSGMTAEPVAKKQKLSPSPLASQDSQSSFADVLARIRMDSQESTESEGGADSWERPRPKHIVESRDSMVFQQVDVDGSYDNLSIGPQFHMFGVTQEGHSVLAHVTGFWPYFFIAVPRGFQNEDIEPFKEDLNALVNAVKSIELVPKRSLWGYRGDDLAMFMKITATEPRSVPRVRGIFERGETNFRGLFSGPVLTFESNIPFILRFMIDTNVVGMNWIEIPPENTPSLKERTKSRIAK